MTIVAGVDFGTRSVRVSIVDVERGRLGAGTAAYPVRRRRADPDHATQRHRDHLSSLVAAFGVALRTAHIHGHDVAALAIATTGSTVVPVDKDLRPLGDYYLWCDHRAWREAGDITAAARDAQLEALAWCGNTYSAEWGFAKLLHWLKNNPRLRGRFRAMFEHCDLITATLCGIRDAARVRRSVCAMGHKWMFNAALGGLPPDVFLASVDPLLQGMRDLHSGPVGTSLEIAGELSSDWAARLGLRAGIPLPIGALDAHWDAIGVGCRLGDVVNVLGTSSCIMALSTSATPIPGVSGVVNGSIDPGCFGIEAGLSAVGELFDAIARRARTSLPMLASRTTDYRAGQTGLIRLAWDNGDRCVLGDPRLRGVTLGWRLGSTAADELFAAIEGVAFQTRIILDRLLEHGVPVRRVIHGGGIPQRNPVLNRVFANVIGRPVLLPEQDPTGMGSAMFAALACGAFRTLSEAQSALCGTYQEIEPSKDEMNIYESEFTRFRELYFQLGAMTIR